MGLALVYKHNRPRDLPLKVEIYDFRFNESQHFGVNDNCYNSDDMVDVMESVVKQLLELQIVEVCLNFRRRDQ